MNRNGFTIIELLIVMAIIGLLAAIALPKLTGTKGKAQIAAMKSDLRNLVTVEENFFAESLRYTTSPGDYAVTTGNTAPDITLTPGGWTASLRNAGGTQMCAVYMGATPLPPATKEGVPTCARVGAAASPTPTPTPTP